MRNPISNIRNLKITKLKQLEMEENFNIRTEFSDGLSSARRVRLMNYLRQSMTDICSIVSGMQSVVCQMQLTIAFDSSEMNSEYGYYDPGTNVIALDPDRPGALAHELFHAVDFHLATAFGIGPNVTLSEWLEDKASYDEDLADGVNKEVFARTYAYDSFWYREFEEQMKTIDELTGTVYLSLPHEMRARVFQAYVAIHSDNELLNLKDDRYTFINEDDSVQRFRMFPPERDVEKMVQPLLRMIAYADEHGIEPMSLKDPEELAEGVRRERKALEQTLESLVKVDFEKLEPEETHDPPSRPQSQRSCDDELEL